MNVKFFFTPPSAAIRELLPRDLVLSVLAAICFLFVGAIVVYADDGTTVATTASSQVVSYLFDTIITLLGLAGAWIIRQVISLLGITDVAQRQKVEDATRQVLHFTIANGLKYAFTKAGVPPTLTPTADVIADAMFYVENHSPDALNSLDVTEDALKRLVLAKLQDVVPWIGGSGVDTIASPVIAAA